MNIKVQQCFYIHYIFEDSDILGKAPLHTMNVAGLIEAQNNRWAQSSESGIYRLCVQRRFRLACRIRAVSPEPPLLVHTSSESRGTFRQKTRSLALLNCWACAVKVCHDGMLEDTNSLDARQIMHCLNISHSYYERYLSLNIKHKGRKKKKTNKETIK